MIIDTEELKRLAENLNTVLGKFEAFRDRAESICYGIPSSSCNMNDVIGCMRMVVCDLDNIKKKGVSLASTLSESAKEYEKTELAIVNYSNFALE